MCKGRQLITPREDVLRGITRGFVLRVAKSNFEVKERSVTLQELLRADEVFITATNKKVLPVVKIDKTVIGKGVPGEHTKELMERFSDAADRKSGIMAL